MHFGEREPENKAEHNNAPTGLEFYFPQISSHYLEIALKSPNPSILRKDFETALTDAFIQVILKIQMSRLVTLIATLKELSNDNRQAAREAATNYLNSFPPGVAKDVPMLVDIANRVVQKDIEQKIESLEKEILALEAQIEKYDKEIKHVETEYASELFDIMQEIVDKDGNPLFKQQIKEEFIEKKRQSFKQIPAPVERMRGSKIAIADYRQAVWKARPEFDKAGHAIPLAPVPPEIAKELEGMRIAAVGKSTVLQQIESLGTVVRENVIHEDLTPTALLELVKKTAAKGLKTEAEVKTTSNQLKSSQDECKNMAHSIRNELKSSKKRYRKLSPDTPSKAEQKRFEHK